MTNELSQLEALIALIANSAGLDESLKLEAGKIVSSESNRIKEAWVKILFASQNEKQLEVYVQHQQTSLVLLADRLAIQPDKKCSSPGEIEKLRKELFSIVEDLLHFVERHFSRYFNVDEKLPDSYYRMEQKALSQGFDQLCNAIYRRCSDQQLARLALTPLTEFIKSTSNTFSYRHLIFVKELRKELLLIADTDQSTDLCTDIIACMIYLNYNSYRFLKHVNGRFKSAYLAKSGLKEQLEVLLYWVKEVNQQQVKPGFAWKPNLCSLKTQLSNWLAEELAYLEKTNQLADSNSTLQPVGDAFRVKTDLSVPQLAFFTRLLIETGVIVNKNSLEVMRFIARTFRTRLVDEISAESFRTKFYTVDTAARAGVKDVVIKLLNQVNKS